MFPLPLISLRPSCPFRDLFPPHSFLFEEFIPLSQVEVEQHLQL